MCVELKAVMAAAQQPLADALALRREDALALDSSRLERENREVR
jgi:hypothetical protein